MHYGVETDLADLDQGHIAHRNSRFLYNRMPSVGFIGAQVNYYHQQAFNQPLQQQVNRTDLNGPLAGPAVTKLGDYYHQQVFNQALQQQTNEIDVI